MVDSFQKAGVDLSTGAPGGLVNLARGQGRHRVVHDDQPGRRRRPSPANAVDGFTISGLPVTSGSYVGTNPIWGDVGSPNAQDWLQVDLGAPTRFNDVKLYFYSNKAFGSGGNTYREPSRVHRPVLRRNDLGRRPGPGRDAGDAGAELQRGHLRPGHRPAGAGADDPQPGFAVGVKELQVQFTYSWHGFFERVANPPAVNTVTAGATVPVKFNLGGDQGLSVLASGSPQFQPLFCGTTTPSGAAVPAGRGSAVHYDPSSGQYVITWMTDRAWRGTCGRLDVGWPTAPGQRQLHLLLTNPRCRAGRSRTDTRSSLMNRVPGSEGGGEFGRPAGDQAARHELDPFSSG